MAYTISQRLNIRPKYFPHVVVHVSAGDANIPVHFSIYDGASTYTIPSGTTITVHGYRKDGGNWIVNGTYSGNVVSFTLPQAAMAIEGAGIADVVFTTGNEVVGSANFCLLVERATFPNGVSYSNDSSVFQDLLNFINSSAIPESISDWLEENITPTTPAVDASLSVSGAAADAAVTGALKNELKAVENEEPYKLSMAWEHGGIDNATGETNNNGSLSRTRCLTYLKESDLEKVVNNTSGRAFAILYSEENNTYTFTGYKVAEAGETLYFDSESEKYIRFDVRASLESTSSDVSIFCHYKLLNIDRTIAQALMYASYTTDPSNSLSQLLQLMEYEPNSITIDGQDFVLGSIATPTTYDTTVTTRRSLISAITGLRDGQIITITPNVSQGITAMGFRAKKPNGTVVDLGWIESDAWPFVVTIGDSYKGVTSASLTFSGGTSHNNDLTNESITSVKVETSFFDMPTVTLPDNKDEISKAIAHRGFSNEAPENTLPAYKLARKKGFTYAETDVSFTSDNVPVCLHDSTIDRTSTGTGNITEMTFATARTYDFGSWKGSAYTGTKIPSFEEFIALCKNIGLKPYVEIKQTSSYTSEQLQMLLDIVNRYSMHDNTTWISFSASFLSTIKTLDDSVRLGYVVNKLSSNALSTAQGLKTANNEVFLDTNAYTTETLQACIDANMPVEMWYGDTTESNIKSLDPYITGVTNNSLLSGNIIFDANIK